VDRRTGRRLPSPGMGHLYLLDVGRPLVTGLSRVLVRVKVKVTLEQATKAQKGSRGIALLFL